MELSSRDRNLIAGAVYLRPWAMGSLAVAVFSLVHPGSAQAQCASNADCNDNLACTDDICVVGVSPVCLNISTCDDGAFCNGLEVCGGAPPGTCLPGTSPCVSGLICDEAADRCVECLTAFSCNDSNPCTDDVCNPDGTCSNPQRVGFCDDGDPCTTTDTCVGEVCVGTVVDCNAAAPNSCLFGTCDPGTGACQFTAKPDGVLCNDDDPCTALDVCTGGFCIGGPGTGCVGMEFRVAGGATTIQTGDAVEVQVWLTNNGCPTPPAGVCSSNLGQAVDGFELAFSWDTAFFALVDPIFDCTVGLEPDADLDGLADNDNNGNLIPDECENPQDPCISLDECITDCGLAVATHNWLGGGSSFPQDCSKVCSGGADDGAACTLNLQCSSGNCAFTLDGINAPCPGFPDNDGDALLLAFKEIRCGLSSAEPACVGPGGLLATILKFKAVAASAGVAPPAEIVLEACLRDRTRSKVASGITPGEDLLGQIGPAVQFVIECGLDADCPAGQICVARSCGAFPAPLVEVVGPRYLRVVPPVSSAGVAFEVTGVDAEVACVLGYVGASGRLGSTPVFQLPGLGGWGDSVMVHGAEMVSGLTYAVRADFDGANPGVSMSQPATATLWQRADTDNNGVPDILDVTRIIDGFRAVFNSSTVCTSDLDCANIRPVFQCDTTVNRCVRLTLENVDLISPVGCVPDGSIDIVDVTTAIDAFRRLADPCATVCP